jgi:hypothetical protein
MASRGGRARAADHRGGICALSAGKGDRGAAEEGRAMAIGELRELGIADPPLVARVGVPGESKAGNERGSHLRHTARGTDRIRHRNSARARILTETGHTRRPKQALHHSASPPCYEQNGLPWRAGEVGHLGAKEGDVGVETSARDDRPRGGADHKYQSLATDGHLRSGARSQVRRRWCDHNTLQGLGPGGNLLILSF